MSAIVVSVMKAMCNHYPEFDLFFNSHYAIVKEEPEVMMPTFDRDGNPTFDEGEHKIVRRKITTEDKNKYYRMDMELWNSVVNEQIRQDGKR